MVRSDYFRLARARMINSCPGPEELYHVVNRTVARHMTEEPPPILPDLAAALAEASE